MNTRLLYVRSAAVVLISSLAAVSALAQPSWYDSGSQSGIEPGSPDFYQHQITGTIANNGFCDYFAFEDAMYYDHNQGFPNLYTDFGNWVDGMVTNFLNIHKNLMNLPPNPPFMQQWINSPNGNPGYGTMLGVNSVSNNAGGNFIYNSMTSSLLAGSNVLVDILPGSNTNQWWGFHVMDVVGFSATNHQIVVLDPDNNQYGGYGIPGTPPFNLVYYTNSQPLPVETGAWNQVGNPTNSLMQAYTVDANGNITDGIYAGTHIDWTYDIGPVPEPSPVALGTAAVFVFGMVRHVRRRQRERGR